MDNRSYQIIYRYKHDNGNILQGIKYIDLPEDTQEIHWFHIQNKTKQPLSLIHQNGLERYFIQGTLIIYPEHCLFNGEKYIIQNISFPMVLSKEFYFHGIPTQT
jgi:hypothetical protein